MRKINADSVRTRDDASLELLRVFLMFGICMIHAGNVGQYHLMPWWYFWDTCVTCFVFLSGYFGANFRISKIVKLYLIALYSSVVWAAASSYGSPDWSIKLILQNAWIRMMGGCWFLHAYAFMMLFTPLINRVVSPETRDTEGIKKSMVILAPILFLSFVWSPGLVHFFRHLSPDAEFVNFPALTFIGIYAVARMFRVFDLERALTLRQSVIGFILCCLLIMLNPLRDALIFKTCMSGIFVVLFHRIKVPVVCSKIIGCLTPSLFAIYLLHTNSLGFTFVDRAQQLLIGIWEIPRLVAFALIACALFSMSLILDMPRRFACLAMVRVNVIVSDALDNVFMLPFEVFIKIVKVLK